MTLIEMLDIMKKITSLVYDHYKANLAAEIPEAAKNLNLSFNTVSKAVELLQKEDFRIGK